MALGADDQGIRLHYMNEDAFSTMAGIFHQRNEQHSLQVKTQSLSTFLTEQQLDQIDF